MAKLMNIAEKFQMANKIGLSTWYFTRIKRLTGKLRRERKKLISEGKKIDAETQMGDIQGVVKHVKGFANEVHTSKIKDKQIKEYTYTLEWRLEGYLKALIKDLEIIKKSTDKKSDAGKILHDIATRTHSVVNETWRLLQRAKRQAGDLKHDRNRLRDKTVLPTAMIFFLVRMKARQARRDVRHVKTFLKRVHLIAEKFRKNNKTPVSAADLKKLSTGFDDLEKSLREELSDLIYIEQMTIFLSFRFLEMNEAELEKVHGLLTQGFPAAQERELENALKQAESVDSSKKEYEFARALENRAKELSIEERRLAA